MKIGILGLQGGIIEHVHMLRKAYNNLGINGEILIVKKPKELTSIDGIIIPGGESTTIGVLAKRIGLLDELKDLVIKGLPVMGICAGTVMLAKNVVDKKVGKVEQPLLAVMNISVIRNYYGRQKESFEIDIKIPAIGDKPFRCVFIRAPAIIKTWYPTEPLAKLNNVIVAAEQRNMLAITFHPELTNDSRIHEYFIKMIKR
ncbi:MAG: pyridoxal 5'-phosphate synthase glutaminase subunit PdxT [Thermoprotei archaeon]|nr:MAG: pyridoxal 5'-phosphate synthase glutaminase subunit PdxT [Thermoprotei archaeon]